MKNIIACAVLLSSSVVFALPNSVSMTLSGPGTQTVDLENLVTRRVNQSSTISTTCQEYCYENSPRACTVGQYYTRACDQTIDTSYDVPDHTVYGIVEVTVEDFNGLEINQDIFVTLGASSVYVKSSNEKIGFLIDVKSVKNPPRRGEPDYIHKVTLRPLNIEAIKAFLEPKNITISGSVLRFETGPDVGLSVKDSLTFFRDALFHQYSWYSYGKEGFGFKPEPMAGGLAWKVDLAKFDVSLRRNGKYNMGLTRSLADGSPEFTGPVSKSFHGSYEFRPEVSF